MAKHNKVEWKYEVIVADPLTEEEVQQIVQILAEMFYEHYFGIRKEDQQVPTIKEDT